jgi:hypothetical protein
MLCDLLERQQGSSSTLVAQKATDASFGEVLAAMFAWSFASGAVIETSAYEILSPSLFACRYVCLYYLWYRRSLGSELDAGCHGK